MHDFNSFLNAINDEDSLTLGVSIRQSFRPMNCTAADKVEFHLGLLWSKKLEMLLPKSQHQRVLGSTTSFPISWNFPWFLLKAQLPACLISPLRQISFLTYGKYQELPHSPDKSIYWPISVLPVISRFFEKLVANQLSAYEWSCSISN